MLCILKNDDIEVFIKKEEQKYLVNIKSKYSSVRKEFYSRLELISLLEKSFTEKAFHNIP